MCFARPRTLKVGYEQILKKLSPPNSVVMHILGADRRLTAPVKAKQLRLYPVYSVFLSFYIVDLPLHIVKR